MLDDAALPHDCDAVGANHDLAQLVGDKNEAIALAAQLGDRLEQALGLLRRQHLGRFVEDQNARAGEELFQDLDLLPIAHRETADREPKVDRKAQPVGQRAHAAAQLRGPDSPRQILEEERDVFPDGERRDQAEVLEHHADAEAAGIARRGDRDRSTRYAELAGVGPVIAVQNLAQRALAGAVFAEQRHDLAWTDRKIGDVVG